MILRAEHLAAALLWAGVAAPLQAAEVEEEASLELIEFLGEWETDDGAWVDPFSLDEEDANDAQGETDE